MWTARPALLHSLVQCATPPLPLLPSCSSCELQLAPLPSPYPVPQMFMWCSVAR